MVFFIWAVDCVEETGFGKLVTSLSNDIETPLCYNYTVKVQNWISVAYCCLNSFFGIIMLIHE